MAQAMAIDVGARLKAVRLMHRLSQRERCEIISAATLPTL